MRRLRPVDLIRRILIVEDEPLIAFETEHFLNAAGYVVVATVDAVGEAIFQIGCDPRLDLVITDLALAHGGTGLDVARAARARSVPVLIVTGNSPEGAQALASGCLRKPYVQRDLGDAIAAIQAMSAGQTPGRIPRNFSLYPHAF